jgi:predicted nucleotidyltransferase
MSIAQNIARIKAVHNALEDLADQVVFLGGATVALYADRSFGDVRPTDDVDILVEVLKYNEYAQIEEKLRQKGFVNDLESGITCRYLIHGITVDVMPSDGKVLGFGNPWYAEAFKHAIQLQLDERITLKIFAPVYFLVAKLEAFKNRGGNDGRTSTDFEDIVFLLNKRSKIWDELEAAPAHVREYLIKKCTKLLEEKYIEEWIGCHLDFDEQKKANLIMGGLRNLVGQ